jgi:hypothetical protein
MDSNYRKMDADLAVQVVRLHSKGLDRKQISAVLGLKPMDVFNVLRGNSYSNVTGMLNEYITDEELIVTKYFLDKGFPYREVAKRTDIDANKVRNIKGRIYYLRRRKLLSSR